MTFEYVIHPSLNVSRQRYHLYFLFFYKELLVVYWVYTVYYRDDRCENTEGMNRESKKSR